MIITICGSMSFAKEMLEAKLKLEKAGHKVYIPKNTERFTKIDKWVKSANKMGSLEGAKLKIEQDLIRGHYNRIKKSDAILVINKKKGKYTNYIGGNTFLEMGFAHVLKKGIFVTNPLPKYIKYFYQELVAMRPVVINNDLSKIC